ncbi:MAG: hypothetical protein E6R04_11730 [Spirochaetes bacterium]|jgi:hypothetical protein|nr:MAG: hypothetical protein E6R04_11730 [Spirochaetota bacterium]
MSTKLDHEKAVDEFLEIDQKYTTLESQFMSGELLSRVMGGIGSIPPDAAESVVEQFKAMIEEFKNLLDERNTRLQNAKNALRQAVHLAPSQWRGRDGKSSVLNYGSFSVSSVTRRWLDGETLKMNATSKGIYDDLKKLKGFDKDGKEYNLIQEKIEVDYESVVKWLVDHGHVDLVESAYDEREVTAQVKGPKPLAFFGEKKGDS